MRTTTRILGLALAGVLAFGLVGCVQSTPTVIPTSQPESKPVFATDADALAAAKKAYVAYLAVSDEIAHKGGEGVSALKDLDTGAQFKRDENGFATMKADEHHTTGESGFSSFSLQRSSTSQVGVAEISAYICIDISKTTLLNKSGKDIGADRPLQLPLEVSFVGDLAGSKSLLIERSDPWNGTNFCS